MSPGGDCLPLGEQAERLASAVCDEVDMLAGDSQFDTF